MDKIMQKDYLKSQLDRLIPEFKKPLEDLVDLLRIEPSQFTVEISNKGIYLIDENNQFKFQLNISDPRTAISCLLVQGYYEPTETELLTQLAKVSTNILDIGANVGYYAVTLGKVMPAGSKLYAIEPLSSAYNQLVSNVSLNNLDKNVSCHKIAFSETEGFTNLYIPLISGSSASSMRELHPEELNKIESVKSIMLDNFISQFCPDGIDLIKIDVEGAELLVLESGWNSIQFFKPIIFAELLRKWSAEFGYKPEKLKNKLENLGYTCYQILPKNQISIIEEINEQTISTNFLFIPESKIDNLNSILEKFIY